MLCGFFLVLKGCNSFLIIVQFENVLNPFLSNFSSLLFPYCPKGFLFILSFDFFLR